MLTYNPGDPFDLVAQAAVLLRPELSLQMSFARVMPGEDGVLEGDWAVAGEVDEDWSCDFTLNIAMPLDLLVSAFGEVLGSVVMLSEPKGSVEDDAQQIGCAAITLAMLRLGFDLEDEDALTPELTQQARAAFPVLRAVDA